MNKSYLVQAVVCIAILCLFHFPLMAQWNLVTTISSPAEDVATGGGSFYLAEDGNVLEYTLDGTFIDSDAYGAVSSISYDNGLYVEDDNNVRDVEHDAAGNIYELYEEFIGRFNAAGAQIGVYAPLSEARQVAICPVTGNVAVADFGGHEVVMLDSNLGYLSTISLLSVEAVAFDAVGNLFAGSAAPQLVHIFEAGNYVFNFSFDLNDQLGSIESMVFLSNGNLVITQDDETLIASNAVLPVTLVDFTVRQDDEKHLLSWEAATEVNFDFYKIQHSMDGIYFKPIDIINGRGSNSSYQYSTTPRAESNYYRLKQVDLDGTFEYSKTVSLRQAEDDKPSIYPNPSNGRVTVTHPATIFTASGEVVATTTANQSENLLAKGFYIVKFSSGETQKLIVIE